MHHNYFTVHLTNLYYYQGWQHFKDGSREILYSLELWRSHLKLIHGESAASLWQIAEAFMGCKINNLWLLIVILKTDMQCYPITLLYSVFFKKNLWPFYILSSIMDRLKGEEFYPV